MDSKKIVVIGCGIMGAQIALLFASHGHNVNVFARNGNSVQKGKSKVEGYTKNPFWKRLFHKTGSEPKIEFTNDITVVGNADLVIESIVENVETKRQLFNALSAHISEHTVLATTSSSIPLEEIAINVKNEMFNLHFFNPILSTKFVEISTLPNVKEETVQTVQNLLHSLSFNTIVVQDQAGLIINKALIPFLFSSVKEYEISGLSPDEIDEAFISSLKHPVGPLKLCDMTGLDTLVQLSENLFRFTGETKFKAPEIMKELVSKGKTGQKSGQGFYQWT